jgi:pyruvate formate lyase activating enzyme
MSTVFSASRLTIRLVDTRAERGRNIDKAYRMGIAAISSKLHEAGWWETSPNRKLRGYLCPRHCEIGEGLARFCFIRKNIGGRLYNLGYAQPAVMQVDPIEKKPLNHFLPDTKIFSLGTVG